MNCGKCCRCGSTSPAHPLHRRLSGRHRLQHPTTTAQKYGICCRCSTRKEKKRHNRAAPTSNPDTPSEGEPLSRKIPTPSEGVHKAHTRYRHAAGHFLRMPFHAANSSFAGEPNPAHISAPAAVPAHHIGLANACGAICRHMSSAGTRQMGKNGTPVTKEGHRTGSEILVGHGLRMLDTECRTLSTGNRHAHVRKRRDYRRPSKTKRNLAINGYPQKYPWGRRELP